MMQAAGPSVAPAAVLHEALLDFFAAPGRYPVASRQPEALFESLLQVLQIAARGPGPDVLPTRARAVRQAAMFFIRTALLHPEADHYQLMGLPPRTEPEDLKKRYRLLMRLLHPDYAADAGIEWPADAAARVNRAYEVLSSPALRRDYDQALESGLVQVPRSAPPTARAAGRPAARPGRRAAWALGGLALLVLLGAAVVLLPRGEQDHLVQLPPQGVVASADRAAPAPAAAQALPPAGPQTASPAPASPLAASPPAATPAPATLPPAVPPVGAQPPGRPLADGPLPGAGPSLREVQPLLTVLLQTLESGSGSQLARLVHGEGARAPGVQALVRHYDAIARGPGPVRLAAAQFIGQPRQDALRVTSRVQLQVGDPAAGARDHSLVLQADFAARGGRIVLTALGEGG